MLVLLMTYGLAMSFLPRFSDIVMLWVHFVHALLWCLIHYVGLGFLLKAQSENKFLVRHFMKNYHYAVGDDGSGPVVEAFSNWKTIYNLSMCMTYGLFSFHCVLLETALNSFLAPLIVSSIGLVWKTYSIPYDWSVGSELLRHTLGLVRLGHQSSSDRADFQI
jgi:phosphatidylethanolamine N-methyltransferase